MDLSELRCWVKTESINFDKSWVGKCCVSITSHLWIIWNYSVLVSVFRGVSLDTNCVIISRFSLCRIKLFDLTSHFSINIFYSQCFVYLNCVIFILYLLWSRANAGFRRLLITFKWLDLKPLKSGVIIPWTRSKIFALLRGFLISLWNILNIKQSLAIILQEKLGFSPCSPSCWQCAHLPGGRSPGPDHDVSPPGNNPPHPGIGAWPASGDLFLALQRQ